METKSAPLLLEKPPYYGFVPRLNQSTLGSLLFPTPAKSCLLGWYPANAATDGENHE